MPDERIVGTTGCGGEVKIVTHLNDEPCIDVSAAPFLSPLAARALAALLIVAARDVEYGDLARTLALERRERKIP
jgi:hypothetical protein